MKRDEVLGKNVLAASAYYTVEEIPQTFAKVKPETGKGAQFMQIDKETFKGYLAKAGLPEFAQEELYKNMAFMHDFEYYGKKGLDDNRSIILGLHPSSSHPKQSATSTNYFMSYFLPTFHHSTSTTMDQSYWAVEARIEECIIYLSENPGASIASVARENNITIKRLQRRCAGNNSKSNRPATNKTLINEMEKALCEYIY